MAVAGAGIAMLPGSLQAVSKKPLKMPIFFRKLKNWWAIGIFSLPAHTQDAPPILMWRVSLLPGFKH